MDRAAFQPTMRRENTSVMNATYTMPDQVEQYVKSQTHNWSGRIAVKSRLTRSGALTWSLSALVVNRFFARLAPQIPWPRINRAT